MHSIALSGKITPVMADSLLITNLPLHDAAGMDHEAGVMAARLPTALGGHLHPTVEPYRARLTQPQHLPHPSNVSH